MRAWSQSHSAWGPFSLNGPVTTVPDLVPVRSACRTDRLFPGQATFAISSRLSRISSTAGRPAARSARVVVGTWTRSAMPAYVTLDTNRPSGQDPAAAAGGPGCAVTQRVAIGSGGSLTSVSGGRVTGVASNQRGHEDVVDSVRVRPTMRTSPLHPIAVATRSPDPSCSCSSKISVVDGDRSY